MPCPSQDQALLAAVRRFPPSSAAPAPSVRRVADAAGVNPAMAHDHLGSKDGFLRALLQRHCAEMAKALSPNSRAAST